MANSSRWNPHNLLHIDGIQNVEIKWEIKRREKMETIELPEVEPEVVEQQNVDNEEVDEVNNEDDECLPQVVSPDKGSPSKRYPTRARM